MYLYLSVIPNIDTHLNTFFPVFDPTALVVVYECFFVFFPLVVAVDSGASLVPPYIVR